MSARLAVLGSTGSIGRQSLEVAAGQRDRVRVTALAAGSRLEELEAQVRRFQPADVALERAADPLSARERLRAAASGARVRVGAGSAEALAAECDASVVLNGIVGAAGLAASLRTLERGLRLALANKETLVVGGELVRPLLARGGELMPVDSEHSAALQCLGGRPASEVRRLTLTASGGALRDHADWRTASPAEVLRHPVWAMGSRITVDSALLTNKAFELIEAHWMFALDWHQLEAWIHPQAIVHALVAFTDGAVVAQAAPPDMRLPIQLALSWPARWSAAVEALEARQLTGLSFQVLESGRFPAFDIALAAGREGGTAPCALNAADEVAVSAFLEGRITLGQVPQILEQVMADHSLERVESFEHLREVDLRAREAARGMGVGA